MSYMSHGYMPNTHASARYGTGKKVTVTTTASVIISASSHQVGCVVRVLELNGGATKVTFGNENLTSDSGSTPGGHLLSLEGQGFDLNITGNILAVTDQDTAVIVVVPLLVDGYGGGLIR